MDDKAPVPARLEATGVLDGGWVTRGRTGAHRKPIRITQLKMLTACVFDLIKNLFFL